MHINFKTKLQKISLALFILFLISIFFLIYQKYIGFIVAVLMLIAFSRAWYLELGEELIIYSLKRDGGQKDYNSIVSQFDKNGAAVLTRLTKKKVVDIDANIVKLCDINRPCSFRI